MEQNPESPSLLTFGSGGGQLARAPPRFLGGFSRFRNPSLTQRKNSELDLLASLPTPVCEFQECH